MKRSRLLILTVLGIFLLNGAIAQEFQWASKVLRFSSQKEKKKFNAQQVLGKPNALPQYGSSPVAWAPFHDDSRTQESVMVEFEKPIKIQQIAIGENLNPGAIAKIYLFDTRNKQKLVYENKDIKPLLIPGRMFYHYIPLTDYKVKRLKLIIDPEKVNGSNQIDAIGISSSRDPLKASINIIEYEEYEGGKENLGPGVNTREHERLPIISPDGKTLYFARKYQKNDKTQTLSDDIFYAGLIAENKWGRASSIGQPLNNKFHNFVASVSPDGQTLILANEYSRTGDEGVSVSKRKGGEWSKPKSLKIKSMYNNNHFTCYHMDVDGEVILYAIEQNDSYGDMDIYVSFKVDEKNWSSPMNLGPQINTAGVEGSAYIAADGMSLYFSSEGHSGYGGLDMYLSRRLDNSWQRWSDPVNLGPKINSQGNEFNYTIPASGNYAYFASDNGEYGGSDLYRIPLPREVQPLPVALIKGIVIDAITREPIPVEIKTYRNSLFKEGKEEKITETIDGKFGLIVPADGYDLIVEAPGYFQESDPNLNQPFDEDLYLDFDEKDTLETIKRAIKEQVILELETQMTHDGLDMKGIELPKEDPEKIKEDLKNTIEEKLEEQANNPGEPDINPQIKKEMAKDLEEELTGKIDEINKSTEYVEMEKEINMIPLKEGQIIRVNNIYFKANKAYLMPESDEELDRVVEFLTKNIGIHAEIGGHTNGLPSHEFCQELSAKRAKRVYRYLTEKGVDENRLTYKGYGKTKPVADNSSLAGRKKNQRVELKILRID